jgi:hypothetical protein
MLDTAGQNVGVLGLSPLVILGGQVINGLTSRECPGESTMMGLVGSDEMSYEVNLLPHRNSPRVSIQH